MIPSVHRIEIPSKYPTTSKIIPRTIMVPSGFCSASADPADPDLESTMPTGSSQRAYPGEDLSKHTKLGAAERAQTTSGDCVLAEKSRPGQGCPAGV
jgi:hypothetical protein